MERARRSAPIFRRVDSLPAITRPQEPKKPYPYTEEEVSYDNKPGGAQLRPYAYRSLPRAISGGVVITGSGQRTATKP